MQVMCAMSGGVDSSVARAAAEGGRPRRGRRHDEAVGRRQRHRLLLGQRCRRRPPRRPAARHRPSRVQLRRRLRRARRRSVRRRARRGHHAQPVHRVQPAPEVRPARRAGRPARVRRDRHRPPRPRRADRRRAVHDRTRRRSGEGPELRRAHARPGDSSPARCSPSATCRSREVRALAAALGLRTADKPDSQDVCFIMSTGGGRTTFLGDRIPFHRARSSTPRATDSARSTRSSSSRSASARASACPAADRSGTSLDVDVAAGVVVVGDDTDLLRPGLDVHDVTWVDGAVGETDVLVQCSAHGDPRRATIRPIPTRKMPGIARSANDSGHFRMVGAGGRDQGHVGRAAAADRAGPERRVLRPGRHAGARRRDRRLISRRAGDGRPLPRAPGPAGSG